MSTVFTPTRMRITVDRYQKMVTTGVLSSSDHVELIEGDILERAPITARHASVIARMLKRLTLELAAADVRASNPVDLGDCSEPEPDLVILKPRADYYARAHPQAQDVLLLIEVAESSLAFDQGAKRDLYARFGVCEYWVVDLAHERVGAYLRPVQGVFQQANEYRSEEAISPQSFPEIKLRVRELLGR
jgi:Uma2 family endonuclease